MGLFRELDDACHGKLTEIWAICLERDYELHLSVTTFLDGLPGEQMKLFVQAFKDGKTMLFAQAPLEGKARALGWNIYLFDKLDSAKSSLAGAEEKIDRAALSPA